MEEDADKIDTNLTYKEIMTIIIQHLQKKGAIEYFVMEE